MARPFYAEGGLPSEPGWAAAARRTIPSKLQVGDAPPATRTGRYLVAWKREADGRWRYRVDAIIPDPAG